MRWGVCGEIFSWNAVNKIQAEEVIIKKNKQHTKERKKTHKYCFNTPSWSLPFGSNVFGILKEQCAIFSALCCLWGKVMETITSYIFSLSPNKQPHLIWWNRVFLVRCVVRKPAQTELLCSALRVGANFTGRKEFKHKPETKTSRVDYMVICKIQFC